MLTAVSGRPAVCVPAFNFQSVFALLAESERYGAWSVPDHKIFGDQMVAYANVFIRT